LSSISPLPLTQLLNYLPMSVSLQDQLKKSGLIDDKKAKQLKRAKNKQEKLARKTKNPAVDEHKSELDRAKSEQMAKDRQLNLEKNRQAEKHALAAQIKQLIEMNIVAKDGDQKFSFTDTNVIKHIYVSQTQIDQLSRGTLAIVTQKQGQKHNHVVVPMGVAKKIEQRDAKLVVFKAQQSTIREEDDPYADYQIPDDLTW
jgi:uncharacterized protein YaiL (DUF2058 family)